MFLEILLQLNLTFQTQELLFFIFIEIEPLQFAQCKNNCRGPHIMIVKNVENGLNFDWCVVLTKVENKRRFLLYAGRFMSKEQWIIVGQISATQCIWRKRSCVAYLLAYQSLILVVLVQSFIERIIENNVTCGTDDWMSNVDQVQVSSAFNCRCWEIFRLVLSYKAETKK